MNLLCLFQVLSVLIVSSNGFSISPLVSLKQNHHLSSKKQFTTSGSTALYNVDNDDDAPPPVDNRTFDRSKSGGRSGRMDKLAEMDSEMVETDKNFVLYAAGGFVGLIVVLLIVAYSTGVFDQLIMNS
mmetsp:Transcript_25889/g.29611  ORF Transcript_25889/g.29611 Transcript_25889/m.29611 type:complete len:128 (-) Transcript_25889:137-520(-)|eukprot:CAMPEP_0194135942 /NCGR_PEP_ID=MMETSP0152-20130528/6006_1 /TAXON_ID=1049557 /ORGANISM="Thalassiothrix antarctica, Strain L6-D1" /LENGTH=127 /DNA_ID=CAMNT_0038832403 /DNA_START=53 /DNA_END=436 /DNA_ORIENTATION=+